MNSDDIRAMARASFLEHLSEEGTPTWWTQNFAHIERFAALVAAAEREACARVAEQNAELTGHLGGYITTTCEEIVAAIRARGSDD